MWPLWAYWLVGGVTGMGLLLILFVLVWLWEERSDLVAALILFLLAGT